MRHWYVIHSKPRKEQFVCEQFRIRNIDTFFPCIRARSARRFPRKPEPYFPGYLFAHIDLEYAGQSLLDWLPGAIGIVNFGGEPAPVSDQLIQALQQYLDMINASLRGELKGFDQGDLVAIHAGPFTGCEAIFDVNLPGRGRVEVLLKLLQDSHVRVELPIEQISFKEKTSLDPQWPLITNYRRNNG